MTDGTFNNFAYFLFIIYYIFFAYFLFIISLSGKFKVRIVGRNAFRWQLQRRIVKYR